MFEKCKTNTAACADRQVEVTVAKPAPLCCTQSFVHLLQSGQTLAHTAMYGMIWHMYTTILHKISLVEMLQFVCNTEYDEKYRPHSAQRCFLQHLQI